MKEREKITMLTTIIIVVAIYFVAMLGIGWYGRRYSSTFDGYLSMGRSGGILLLMGSAIGANIGNGFVVGGAGGGATSGLAGLGLWPRLCCIDSCGGVPLRFYL